MRMELGNTGILFGNPYDANQTTIDPKYIKFNSEISIRKGKEGWTINSRVDNWSTNSNADFEYLLTAYKYEKNKWITNGDPRLWGDPSLTTGNPVPLTSKSDNGTINIQNKSLVIKVPTETWFNSSDWVSPSSEAKTKAKQILETKSFSGVWIEDSNKEDSSWIFGDIELYVGEKKYSQVFCGEEENHCFQLHATSRGITTKKTNGSDTWSNAFSKSIETSEKIQDIVTQTVKEIIGKLKNSKGSWAKIEEICESEVSETPDEEQQKQLRMYCSNGKTN